VVLEEGMEQIKGYRDTIDKKTPAYLVVFDRRAAADKAPWDERIYWKEADGVKVVGC
jgi:hypothetical protein